jgi:hypothetical protein
MGRSDQVPRCASSGRSRTHGHFEVEAGTDEHPGTRLPPFATKDSAGCGGSISPARRPPSATVRRSVKAFTNHASASDAPAGVTGRWRMLEPLLATSPALLVAGGMLRSNRRQVSGRLARHGLLGRFNVSAVPRDGRLVPGVATTGAVRDVLCSVQERRGQTAIRATVEVDHVVDILTRVAMHEEPRPGGAPLLALLGIAREPIRPAFGPIVARARPLRLRLAVSARAFKDQIEPIGADRHLPGGRMRNGSCPLRHCRIVPVCRRSCALRVRPTDPVPH